ncbi:hypothetical protein BU17DRAFT_44191 [Hysterangium stoloniferum]|nr:hypothetical protein BU17DRAFT_44191 [Hysterangium stoloniferum]
MLTAKEDVTLVIFIISMIFVIRATKIPFKLPHFKRQVTIPINLTTAPILAIAILWASQCIDPSVIRKGIVGTEGVKPYNILILFFSLAYMAITLDVTGVLRAAAYWVSNKGGSDGWKLYFYFYVLLTLLSVILGNDPVILSGTAFLVYYTEVVEELKPLPWLITEFAAANTASMVLFVGNPTNVVICEGFNVNNAAFTAYTILPFIACNIACFVALALQYVTSKNLPRHITSTTLDVRSVLVDPVSACVGSILLGSCLVVIIVVSFFKIDVWKISLPFAVAKFIFDFAWDYYKPPTAIPVLDLEVPSSDKKSTHLPSVESVLVPSKQIKMPTKAHTKDPDGQATLPLSPVNNRFPPTQIKKIPTSQPSADSSNSLYDRLKSRFPTFFTALPRLPFALVPFAFSQFILIEGLAYQGWIDVFAKWLVRASHRQMHSTIWLVGVLGVILCNISGTNIGATILLTKVVRAANMPPHTFRAAAISLAVASNIGAVSFTFSASLAGLLWQTILAQKGIKVKQTEFAKWNLLPLGAMTSVGLGMVSIEMAVLYKGAKS